jgi:hypothetical protein
MSLIPFAPFICGKKLAMRLRTHGYLASFGGITRIRFKGSSDFSRTSQPGGSPALSFSGENKTRLNEVNIAGAITGRRCQPRKPSGFTEPRGRKPERTSRTPYKRGELQARIIPRVLRLFLPLCWCGKWRAIDRSPVSKRIRRCRSRTYPFHPPSHRASPYRS